MLLDALFLNIIISLHGLSRRSARPFISASIGRLIGDSARLQRLRPLLELPRAAFSLYGSPPAHASLAPASIILGDSQFTEPTLIGENEWRATLAGLLLRY